MKDTLKYISFQYVKDLNWICLLDTEFWKYIGISQSCNQACLFYRKERHFRNF